MNIRIKYKFITDVCLREWQRVVRRPFYFLAPLLVMGFCYLFFLTLMTEGWPNSLPTAVVDLDNSVLSRNLVRSLDASAQTRIVSHCSDYSEARDLMQRGEVYAFVVIPADFARNLQSGHRPELTFYVNDTYLIPGSLSLKDLSFLCQLTSASVGKNVLEARGIVDRDQQMAILQPVAIDAHLVANPWANYSIYLINMLLPGVLQLMVIMITLFTLGTELKEKTSQEWFLRAGGSAGIALTGKMIPYTVFFTLLGITGNLILYRFMHFTFNGSMAWMCLATFLFVLSSQAVGVFFMGLFPVLRDAISLGAFYGLLGFTYAGFTFPIEAMPHKAQVFAWLFPMRYYFLLYGNMALNGSDIRYSIVWLAALTLFLILPLLVIYRFRRAAVYLSYPER